MYSELNYTGDGSTITFPITFADGFLNRADVQCRVNNEVDGFSNPAYRTITWINDGLITISGSPPANGVPVVITRTVSKTVLIHDYFNGAQIVEPNLAESYLQLLMAIQEILDGRIQNAPAVIPSGAVTLAQLDAVEASLQAQIDALTASLAGIEAAAIAAVQAQINSQLAAALANANLSSGDRLINHQFIQNTDTTPYTTSISPGGGNPSNIDGTEILTLTMHSPVVGNTLSCTAHALSSPAGANTAGGIALFINGVFQNSCIARSYQAVNRDSTLIVTAEFPITTTDDIIVSVRAGWMFVGPSIQINNNIGGTHAATLIVEEIGLPSAPHNPGDPWSIDLGFPGLIKDSLGTVVIAYTFTQNVDVNVSTGNFSNFTGLGIGGQRDFIQFQNTTTGPTAGDKFQVQLTEFDGSQVNTFGVGGLITGIVPSNGTVDGGLALVHFSTGDKLYAQWQDDSTNEDGAHASTGADGSALSNISIHLTGVYI